MNQNKIILALLLSVSFLGFSQEENIQESSSNIQTYTPSKLLNKGQWDVKFFNGLYTQTKSADINGNVTKGEDRQNFFTSTLEVFTGVSDNNRFNVGAIFEYRSNTTKDDLSALSVFNFEDSDSARNGLTSIAPTIKFQPIKSIANFSVQSAIHIPLISDSEEVVWLDQSSWVFQNRFFYDYTFSGNKWQLFTEVNTQYSFGDEASFFNNTISLVPSVFMSYFPSNKTTVLGFIQHALVFGDVTQDYTALGFGGKYQLSDTLNLEVLYSNFVRGTSSGLGQSFNLGLRALF